MTPGDARPPLRAFDAPGTRTTLGAQEVTHHGLARREFAAAVERHREARRREAEAFACYEAALARLNPDGSDEGRVKAYGELARWEVWVNLAHSAVWDAEAMLVEMIQAAHGAKNLEVARATKKVCPPRGVAFGGKVYLATPDHADLDRVGTESGKEETREDQTHLVVMELSDLLDFDAPGEPAPVPERAEARTKPGGRTGGGRKGGGD